MPKAPRRLGYLSGRLLAAEDFESEQSYFLDRGRSGNRHLHGWGVVRGLGVSPSAGGGVIVEPGLAIDGLGREIVVPEPRQMPDPRQPIDDRGEQCGDPVDSEVVTICLAYAERPEGDPALFVRETYTLEVRPGRVAPPSRGAVWEAALTGSSEEVARALCEAAASEACDPAERGVPIATVDRREGEPQVALCPRQTIVATEVLLELILSLVQRVRAREERS